MTITTTTSTTIYRLMDDGDRNWRYQVVYSHRTAVGQHALHEEISSAASGEIADEAATACHQLSWRPPSGIVGAADMSVDTDSLHVLLDQLRDLGVSLGDQVWLYPGIYSDGSNPRPIEISDLLDEDPTSPPADDMCDDPDHRTADELLEEHRAWLDEEGGRRLVWSSLTDVEASRLRRADLSQADLSFSDLRHANLSGLDLSTTYLFSANLSQACLRDADMQRAYLAYADLTQADMRGTDIYLSELRHADLTDAVFSCDDEAEEA